MRGARASVLWWPPLAARTVRSTACCVNQVRRCAAAAARTTAVVPDSGCRAELGFLLSHRGVDEVEYGTELFGVVAGGQSRHQTVEHQVQVGLQHRTW